MVKCEKCNWQWDLKDGGSDPYTCHKCGHENSTDRNILFYKWYISWYKSKEQYINIFFSLPNELAPFKEDNVIILDLFEKINQDIDAKIYLNEICEKADEFGVTIYLEPVPRYKYFLKDKKKRQKISKEYLIGYYKKFDFEMTKDNRFMKRLPKKTYKQGGIVNGKDGGLLVGASHEEGGIKGTVNGTKGIEMEGGEGVINKVSMSMDKKVTVTGTPCEIASEINQMGGGVAIPCDGESTKSDTFMYGGSVGYFGYSFSDIGYKLKRDVNNIFEQVLKKKRVKISLGDLISHPELFKMFPNIGKVDVYFTAMEDPSKSFVDSETLHYFTNINDYKESYYKAEISIKLNIDYYEKNRKQEFDLESKNPEYSLEASLLHEIQHVSQQGSGRDFGFSYEEAVRQVSDRNNGGINDTKTPSNFQYLVNKAYKSQPSEQEAMFTVFKWLKEKGLRYGDTSFFIWENLEDKFERGGKVEDYKGMFNPKKTGITRFDTLIENPYGYAYQYKNLSGEVVMMSPDEYLQITGSDGIYEEKKEAIIEAINKGDKINLPYLLYTKEGKVHLQEGRNRAYVSKERGEKLIPVFIGRYSEKFEDGGIVSDFEMPDASILRYGQKLKDNHPEIWDAGGNITGNESFENLKEVSKRGYWLESEKEFYGRWQSFMARHQHNHNLAGVVANIKWASWGNIGEAKAKEVVEGNNKFEEGGKVDGSISLTHYMVGYWDGNSFYKGYEGTDKSEAIADFKSQYIGDAKGEYNRNDDAYYVTIVLSEKTDIYEWIGSEDDDIEDYPIEDYYEDSDYYVLIEEGEWDDVDSVDVETYESKSAREAREYERNLEIEIRSYIESICEESKEAGYIGSTYYGIYKYKDGYILLRIADHFFNVSNVNLGVDAVWDFVEGLPQYTKRKNIYGFISINILNENSSDRRGFRRDFREWIEDNPKLKRLVDYIDLKTNGDIYEVESWKEKLNEAIEYMKEDIDTALEEGVFSEEFEQGGMVNKSVWYRKYNGNEPFRMSDNLGKYGSGIYFSSQKNSRFEGEHEIGCVVNYTKPYIFEGSILPNIEYHREREKSGLSKQDFTDSIFNKGYDAIIVKHKDSWGDELIIRDSGLVEIKEKFEQGGKVSKFDKVISSSSRFRPTERIVFESPLIGENGNELISYEWAYEWTMINSSGDGELKSKRISDWTQAESSAETGRDIVHKFTVKRKDGTTVTVSSETIPSLLGYVSAKDIKNLPSIISSVKTLAKQRMQLAILEAQEKEYKELLDKYSKATKPQIEYIKMTSENAPFALRGRIEQGDMSRAIFVMGDVSVTQDNPSTYNYETGKTIYAENKIPSKSTIENLESNWVQKRIKEDGGKYPNGIYDLRRRVERQEKKVEQATNSKIKITDNVLSNTFEQGGKLNYNKDGIEIIAEASNVSHANEYGIKSKNPLYLKRLFVSEKLRNEGRGTEALGMIEKYARDNKHDIIFGNIAKDENSNIKNWLHGRGYAVNQDNNDFHKVLNKNEQFEEGGKVEINNKDNSLKNTHLFRGGYELSDVKVKSDGISLSKNEEIAKYWASSRVGGKVYKYEINKDAEILTDIPKSMMPRDNPHTHQDKERIVNYAKVKGYDGVDLSGIFGEGEVRIFNLKAIEPIPYNEKFEKGGKVEPNNSFRDMCNRDAMDKYDAVINWDMTLVYSKDGEIIEAVGEFYDGRKFEIKTEDLEMRIVEEFAKGGKVENKEAEIINEKSNNMKSVYDNMKVENWKDLPINWKVPKTPKKVNYKSADWTDKAFMSLLKPFASEDPYKPAMNGVEFNDGYATATNAHKLFRIKSSSSDNKIHSFDGKIIDERFPRYKDIIPSKKDFKNYHFHRVDLLKLKTWTECAVDNFANKTTFQVRLEYGEGKEYGVNGIYLLEFIESFIKTGYTDMTFAFSEPNRAVYISETKESFNDILNANVLGLLMPVIIIEGENFYGAEDLDFEFSMKCYFSFTKNEIINKDGSVAKFDRFLEEKYEGVSKEQYDSLRSIVPKQGVVPIVEYVAIIDDKIIGGNLSEFIVLPNYNKIPNGIYYLQNKALRLDIDTDLQDYPALPKEINDKILTGNISEQISRASVCLGDEDIRPIYKCVNINTELKNIYSADGNRAYKEPIDIKVEKNREISIYSADAYSKAINKLGDNSIVDLFANEKNYKIKGESFEFYGKVNDDRFPDIEQAVIHTPKYSFTLTKEQLTSCHKFKGGDQVVFFEDRIEMVEKDNVGYYGKEEDYPIPHKICDQKFVENENNISINSGYYIMPVMVNPSVKDYLISINYGFLMDAINGLGTESVNIYFQDQKKGIWITKGENKVKIPKKTLKQAVDSLNLMIKLSNNKQDIELFTTFANNIK